MKYNTAIESERKAAMSYFMTLRNKKQIIEVKKVSPGRTLRQNSYLHLLLGFLGSRFGCTLEEMKTIYKRDINPQYYVFRKQVLGSDMAFLKSSADLTKEEMMVTIDNLHSFAREQGYVLPQPEDVEMIRQLENEVEQYERHLYTNL